MSTSSSQILVFKIPISIKKEAGILGEMVDSRSGTEKVKGEPRTFFHTKKARTCSKGYRSQLEGVPTDQTWENLNIKLNNDANEL